MAAVIESVAAADSPRQKSLALPLTVSVFTVLGLVLFGNPIMALVAGITLGLVFDRTLFPGACKAGKLALQAAIVLLAFRLDFGAVVTLSTGYALWVLAYVLTTVGCGLLIGRLLGVKDPLSQLVVAGTAICGASAIVAVAPAVRARSEQLAVALAVVFLLNAIALLTFPWIGQWFELSQEAFGVWTALAVHDTSSVVATAAVYGDESVLVATTLKMLRTLCLVPLVCAFAWLSGNKDERAGVPLFILAFLAVVIVSSFFALPAAFVQSADVVSKTLLIVALFLAGAELRRSTVRELRGRGVVHAVLLWLLVAPLTLLAVLTI